MHLFQIGTIGVIAKLSRRVTGSPWPPIFTPSEINKKLEKSIPKILKLNFEPLKLLEILIQISDVSSGKNQKSEDGEFLWTENWTIRNWKFGHARRNTQVRNSSWKSFLFGQVQIRICLWVRTNHTASRVPLVILITQRHFPSVNPIWTAYLSFLVLTVLKVSQCHQVNSWCSITCPDTRIMG